MMATSPLTCYLVGLGGFSLFTVVFGCLFWAPDGNVLLGLAITLVTLGGLTNTLYLVSMFAVVTTRFRKCPGYIIAFLEFLWGSGTMVGAAIGGALIDFNLSSTETGIVYTVQFASYAAGGVVAGASCSFHLEAFYSLVGLALSSFGYLLVGPAPFLHSTRHLWMVYLSQVFMGLGASAQFICGYCRALKLVLLRGYPDNIRSSGFVSSSVFTFAVFGSIVAPPAAGYLVETFGYPTGSMAMLGLLLAWFPVSFCIWIKSLFPGHKYRTVDTHNGNK
uniref:Putative vesicular amine transporter n=1 Tax=Ixodes scapularis TaxID=6945 RepID=A0A4D5RV37_IXOSC